MNLTLTPQWVTFLLDKSGKYMANHKTLLMQEILILCMHDASKALGLHADDCQCAQMSTIARKEPLHETTHANDTHTHTK